MIGRVQKPVSSLLRNSSPQPLHLQMEILESRRLLAGLVEIDVNPGGDLVVLGDNEANDIGIYIDDLAGQFQVVIEGNNGTLVEWNGQIDTDHAIPLGGVLSETNLVGDLRIRMRGGDDVVDMVTWFDGGLLDIEGNLDVNLGSGRDTFVMEGAPIPDFLEIYSQVHGNTRIIGGSGQAGDYIEVDRVSTDRLDINVGAAAASELDQIVLRDTFATDMHLAGSGGETEISLQRSGGTHATLRTGAGEDQIIVSHSSFVDLDINTGSVSGNAAVGDFALIGSVVIAGDTSITGGAGRTHVVFDATQPMFLSNFMGQVDVNTGNGDDMVRITNNEYTVFESSLEVRTAGGDDSLEIQGETAILGNAEFNMGGGDDLIDFDFNPATDVVAGSPAPPSFFNEFTIRGGAGSDSLHTLAIVSTVTIPNIISIEVMAA